MFFFSRPLFQLGHVNPSVTADTFQQLLKSVSQRLFRSKGKSFLLPADVRDGIECACFIQILISADNVQTGGSVVPNVGLQTPVDHTSHAFDDTLSLKSILQLHTTCGTCFILSSVSSSRCQEYSQWTLCVSLLI